MPKIIHILPHNIEDFIAGDYRNFDHHSTRFLAKIKRFWQKSQPGQKLTQELWLLSKKFKKPSSLKHQNGFLVRLFPISWKLPLPLEISFPLLKEVKNYQCQEQTIWHLHSYYLLMNDFLAANLAKKKQKFVVHFRGGGPSYTIKALWYTLYHYLIGLRISLNRADYVFVQNRTEEKRLLDFLRIKRGKVIYFPNSVPAAEIASENKTILQSPDKIFKIIAAGRVEKINNNPKMLLCLEKILKQNPQAVLEIVGIKKENRNLLALQKKIPQRLQLTRWLDKKALLAKFQQAALFLHTNTKEGFEGSPMTLLEAQSQGLPAVALNISGVRNVIKNGYNGYLVKNLGELPGKISEIIKQKEKIPRLKQNSLKNIRENFTDEKYFPQLIAIYNNLLRF